MQYLVSIPGLTNFEAFGQQPNATNATATISNQTGASDNQTMGVLTQEDFNTLTDNLNARVNPFKRTILREQLVSSALQRLN